MPRYKLTIEYDGRPFVGWQIQDNGLSVQGVLGAAVEAFCGEKASVSGAGRTDAGVHALGQVGHVDLTKDWDVETVRDALKSLPPREREGVLLKFHGQLSNVELARVLGISESNAGSRLFRALTRLRETCAAGDHRDVA